MSATTVGIHAVAATVEKRLQVALEIDRSSVEAHCILDDQGGHVGCDAGVRETLGSGDQRVVRLRHALEYSAADACSVLRVHCQRK